MSLKDFKAKHYQKYRHLFPFMSESQLKVKMKQLWERSQQKKTLVCKAKEKEHLAASGGVLRARNEGRTANPDHLSHLEKENYKQRLCLAGAVFGRKISEKGKEAHQDLHTGPGREVLSSTVLRLKDPNASSSSSSSSSSLSQPSLSCTPRHCNSSLYDLTDANINGSALGPSTTPSAPLGYRLAESSFQLCSSLKPVESRHRATADGCGPDRNAEKCSYEDSIPGYDSSSPQSHACPSPNAVIVKHRRNRFHASHSSGEADSTGEFCPISKPSRHISHPRALSASISTVCPAAVASNQTRSTPAGATKQPSPTTPLSRYPVRLTRQTVRQLREFEEEAIKLSLLETPDTSLVSAMYESLTPDDANTGTSTDRDGLRINPDSSQSTTMDVLSSPKVFTPYGGPEPVGTIASACGEHSDDQVPDRSLQEPPQEPPQEPADFMCDLFRPLPSATCAPDLCCSTENRSRVVSAVLHGLGSAEYSLVEDEDDIFMK